MGKIKKAILQINNSNAGGGANQVVQQIHDYLNNDFNMSMLVEKKSGSDKNIQTFARRSQSSLYRKYFNYSWWFSIITGTQFLSAKLLLNRNFNSLKQLDFYQHSDLIHLHNLHGNYFDLTSLPLIASQRPLIWTLQDMWSFTGHCAHALDCKNWYTNQCRDCHHNLRYRPILFDTSHEFYLLKQKIYQNTPVHLVAASAWLAQQVKKSILADKPLTVIHNGADTRSFHPLNKQKTRKELNLPSDKPIILFASTYGTKNPWKGGNYLKAIIQNNLYPDYYFVTLGAREYKKTNNLIEIPFISDRHLLVKYYNSADLLFYPSIADTFPLTILESMSCGTPVVAFKTGGISEQITHKKDGYLADYKNLDSLLSGIDYLLDSQSRLVKIQTHARQKIVKSFSLDLMIKKYKNLYQQILSTNHASQLNSKTSKK